MIMANLQIAHDKNTFIRVSLYHKCLILANLLIIHTQAKPVDKCNKFIVTITPPSNFASINGYNRTNDYTPSIKHEIKKILSKETIKNCNRSEELITICDEHNNFSNKYKTFAAYVTTESISDKFNNKESEINNLSNITKINHSKSVDQIKNNSTLNDLNNIRNILDIHGTNDIKSAQIRPIFGLNENRTNYSKLNKYNSKCTGSDKISSEIFLLKLTQYITSTNDSPGKSFSTQNTYKNLTNVTSSHSSPLKNDPIFFQSYETMKGYNGNKISYDILKEYISQYIRMKIKCIIAHMKFENEIESLQYEDIDRNSGLSNGENKSIKVKYPNGLRELKTVHDNIKSKKKRFVGTKAYSNSDGNNNPPNKLNPGNGFIYEEMKSLDQIYNSSIKSNLFENKSLTACLKIKSTSSSKDRHFTTKHTSKYCTALPKVESPSLKAIATRDVDKIYLDTKFDEADSLQVEKLMNMDNPQLLNLVKSLIDREIKNNLEDVKVYNVGSGSYERRGNINPYGYRSYHHPHSSLWYHNFQEISSIPSYGDYDVSTLGGFEEPSPSPDPDDYETVAPNGNIDQGPHHTPDIDHRNHGTQDRGSDSSSECSSGLCKQTAMTLVVTFLSTLVGVLVLVFIIFYLWKQCCSAKTRVIYAQPCYDPCCR